MEVLLEKQRELDIAAAALEAKEKQNLELEMELDKCKFQLRQSDLSDRQVKFHGVDEHLKRENAELREKLAAGELRAKAEWNEMVMLRMQTLLLRSKVMKQEGVGARNVDDEIYQGFKSEMLQLESELRESRSLLEGAEWSLPLLEDSLRHTEQEVAELEIEAERLRKVPRGLRKHKKEKDALVNDCQSLEVEADELSESMEALEKKDAAERAKWENARVVISDLLKEEPQDLQIVSVSGQCKTEKDVIDGTGTTWRKPDKKVETIGKIDSDSSDEESSVMAVANAREFSAFWGKANRFAGGRSRAVRRHRRFRL